MKIEIEIKEGTARRIGQIGVTLLIVGVAMGVYADQIQFSSGQTLTAADLNNNFNELYAKTAKPIATFNGNQISVNGVYCGAGPIFEGVGGNYRAAKLLCETACASPTAHMCTSEEVVRSAQLGRPMSQGWYSTGVASVRPAGGFVNDCTGWQGEVSYGVFTQGGAAVPSVDQCNSGYDIMCCD